MFPPCLFVLRNGRLCKSHHSNYISPQHQFTREVMEKYFRIHAEDRAFIYVFIFFLSLFIYLPGTVHINQHFSFYIIVNVPELAKELYLDYYGDFYSNSRWILCGDGCVARRRVCTAITRGNDDWDSSAHVICLVISPCSIFRRQQ